MARVFVGADAPDSGQIFLHGEQVKVASPTHALSLGIGMLPESRKDEGLVLIRSVAENTGYSLVARRERFGFVSWGKIHEEVYKILKAIEIRPAKPNLQVYLMSGGNQQKVVLGKMLT